MSDRFFYEQMVSIMCSPLYIYNMEGKLLDKIGGDDKEWWKWLGYEKDRAMRLLSEGKDYPVICTGDKGYVTAILSVENSGEVLAAGPVMLGSAGDRKNDIRGKKRFLCEKKEKTPAVSSLDTFVSGCLLLYWKLTGREISVSELWEHNKENYEKVCQIRKRISEDMFYRQENIKKHNPGEQELRELESIKNGDKEALRQSISETYEGSIGILAKDPLRHYKNVAIGNITLASRAAIQGGVSLENSYSMADSMIQQVEEINNIPEVEAFKRECQFLYTEAVRNEKERGINDADKNPLIGKAKDYIFSHLHERIKVADIAEKLQVNPNYLTSVFNKSENISIKKYILQEKIRRSQNLLKYSDYHIQDIAFYLGFSSQSHFTRMFQEITGMTPNEYRKKYGYIEKWK